MIYVGAKTGRRHPRRHHGSAGFTDEIPRKSARRSRSAIPSPKKLLFEACLELMATDAIVAIQGHGAAGLTSSSVEMSQGRSARARSRQGAGARDRHDATRSCSPEARAHAHGLDGPGSHEARNHLQKWELDFRRDRHHHRHRPSGPEKNGKVVADMPVAPPGRQGAALSPALGAEPAPKPGSTGRASGGRRDILQVLKQLVGSAEPASRKWVWERYDHLVMGRHASVRRRCRGCDPGRQEQGPRRTSDCTPRYCLADPRVGQRAVAEVGAT